MRICILPRAIAMVIRNTAFIEVFNVLVWRRAETNNNNYKKSCRIREKATIYLLLVQKDFLKKNKKAHNFYSTKQTHMHPKDDTVSIF